MSGLLAPPAVFLRRRSTTETLALDPARELGAGGEARVMAIPGDDSLVAKLYHEPTLAKARKVALMMEEPPELDASAARLAWPCDVLSDDRGAFAGFLMPRVEGLRIFELYNPAERRHAAPLGDYALLHRVGANVAAAFEALHARGYVIGDVNESNLLVDGDASVTLVDTDSMQVRDPADGTVHRSRVGKAEFTPPELQGRSFGDFDRTPEHDRFGLAVLLFLLLMEGTHPFAGRLDNGGEMPPIEERIRRGLFPHGNHAEIRPTRLAPDFSLLAPGLRALFVRCFEDGHADPAARPTAAEWRAALAEAEAKLVTCDVNPRHRHGRHLGACPWCVRAIVLQGRDPFPADAKPAPGRSERVPAKRVVPASPASAPRAPSTLLAGVLNPPVPTQPVAAAPRPAALQASAPAPVAIPGWKSWLKEAMGPRGALHPGAWLAPGAAVALGPPELAGPGIFVLLLLVMATYGRIASGPKPDRLPGTFAAPAALLLVLALWLAAALGGSWLFTSRTAETPSEWTEPSSSGVVRLGTPRAEEPDALPTLENHTSIVLRLRRGYPESPDGKPHRLTLRVYVRADGTVDPARTEISGADEKGLARVVSDVSRTMKFVPFHREDGSLPPGFVTMDVTYGP